jgi:hypothetical protein
MGREEELERELKDLEAQLRERSFAQGYIEHRGVLNV